MCALSFALGLDNFCSNRTTRIFSAVKTSCLFAGRIFRGIFNHCVTERRTVLEWGCIAAVQPLGEEVWLPSGCFPALPSVRSEVWRQANGGISSFQFSESSNAEVQTFLTPETCAKPVTSLLGDEQTGGLSVRFGGCAGIGEVAAWC